MERKALQAKLELVAPALSTISVIPVLAEFAFTGTKLMAYNDSIAIVTSLKTDFKATLPGTTLLNLIRLSKAKEVEMVMDGNDVLIKAASTKIKLPSQPIKEFTDIFTPPEIVDAALLPVNVAEFTRCVGQLMRSVSEDTSVPDQLGVTMVPGEKVLDLYSTNYITMSHAVVKLAKPTKSPRAILSKPFCEQMLILAKGEQALKLEIVDDHSILIAGNTLLIGKLIDSEKPLNFPNMIEESFPIVAKKFAPIPTKMRGIIERALVVSESKNDSAKTAITVKEGRMRFVTKSERGEVTDSMQVTDAQKPTSLVIEPRFLKRGVDFFDEMVMSDRGCVMAKGNIQYMISSQD